MWEDYEWISLAWQSSCPNKRALEDSPLSSWLALAYHIPNPYVLAKTKASSIKDALQVYSFINILLNMWNILLNLDTVWSVNMQHPLLKSLVEI